jgi:hypothetical protein
MMERSTFLKLLVLAAFRTSANPLAACSVACITVQLRRSFTVEVKHDGHPLAGATVTVRGNSESKEFFRAVTGPTGMLTVRKVPSGSLSIYVEYLGMSPEGPSCFTVPRWRTNKAVSRVNFNWNSTYATHTRTASGRLMELVMGNDPDLVKGLLNKIEVPIKSARLTLRKVKSTDEWESVASSDGAFQFPDLPPGLYVLQVDAQGERTPRPSTHMLRIAPISPPGELHLVADGSICGGTSIGLKPGRLP